MDADKLQQIQAHTRAIAALLRITVLSNSTRCITGMHPLLRLTTPRSELLQTLFKTDALPNAPTADSTKTEACHSRLISPLPVPSKLHAVVPLR